MSWKGFQKGIVRAPQNFKNKFGSSSDSKDPIISDAEQRFVSMEGLAKKLHSESTRFWEAIRDLLDHQTEFLNSIELLYKPITGWPYGGDEDAGSNADAVAACQQYRNQIVEIQELIKPEHEMIETKILRPVDELLTLIKKAQKMFTKREHKLLDLERQTEALNKLHDKAERNPKHEERTLKVENDYEMAKEQFSYYDEIIKSELPKLFTLESAIIQPMFQSFYFMQLNIYYTMYTHMTEGKIPYLDMDSDIITAFHAKQGSICQQVESIPLLRTESGSGALHERRSGLGKGDAYAGSPAGTPTSGTPRNGRSFSGQRSQSPDSSVDVGATMPSGPPLPSRGRNNDPGLVSPSPPPPYNDDDEKPSLPQRKSAANEKSPALPSRGGANASADAPAPPPRRAQAPAAAPKKSNTCTALYDFDAQNPNELRIHKGDIIEIVERGNSKEDWWLGELNGVQGYFPGSFVEEH